MDLALIIALTFTILIFFLTSIAAFVTRKRNYRRNGIYCRKGIVLLEKKIVVDEQKRIVNIFAYLQ